MTDKKAKLESKAKRLIKREYVAWLTTIGSDLAPQPRSLHSPFEQRAGQPRPVWFIWDKDVIVYGGSARIDESVPPAHKMPAYLKKYKAGIRELGATPEQFNKEYSVAICVTPTSLRG